MATTVIQRPLDKVVLLDLDKTIIDVKQQLNDERFIPTVRQAQSQGWILGLSSDTPLESLRTWSERFGLNGPTIAEKGAIVQTKNGIVYAKPETVGVFSELFNLAVDKITSLDMKVVHGTPVEIMFKNEVFGNPGDNVVFVNNLRRSSLGIFVLRVDEMCHLIPNKDETARVMSSVESILPNLPTIQKWSSNDRGLIVISDSEISKRNGSMLLMRHDGLRQVGMVGDSMIDYIGSDIAVHYAVGNAAPEFKSKSDYVSAHDLTSGVVDILGQLLRD
jgi:hydroxymethylpyrimidine pyrophosphatase-like HAD family hydrolase